MPTEPPQVEVAKIDTEEQLVFGWAWVSTDPQGNLVVDSQGESIEPEELELAAYDYVLSARAANEMHAGDDVGQMVESVLLTPEKAKAMGLPDQNFTAWWTGFWIEDADAFAKVKDGTYSMFSIEGVAEAVE